MSIIKCKMCGGDMVLSSDNTIGTCEYCGSTMTLPKIDDEKRLALYNRANYFRQQCAFDKAAQIYENIVSETPDDAEAHWSLVLCRYGIEYVEDPETFERIPTCHRASYDSIFDDIDYQEAVKNSYGEATELYKKEARRIDRIQKGILEISQKEESFDVFICYKETAVNGDRTLDSVKAQEIYDALTEKGYKVFFSRITLESKLGQAYEPYIFATLNSAKVMLVVGTSPENINAVWVKNEWSRYLKLTKKDKNKTLIPCYLNMDPYDLPDEFSSLQAQDMSKIGFVQDLIRGIGKILSPSNVKTVYYENNNSNTPTDSLLKRAYLFLKEGNFDKANEYCERVLDQNPENARAYFGKFLAEHKFKSENEIDGSKFEIYKQENNFIYSFQFADSKELSWLNSIFDPIKASLNDAEKQYEYAKRYEDEEDYETAFEWYQKSALQGHDLAQFRLGVMYEKGMGVKQNYAEAVKWYTKSAEQGYAKAQYNLGYMYDNGNGVKQDYAEAVKWYTKSAEQGNADAQCNLGDMYYDGKGVTQDYAEAVKWYTKSAEQGNATAQYYLGLMYYNGKGVKQNYAEAVKWYTKSAEQGYAKAQYNLGYMYDNGNGVKQDYAEAVKWYKKSAEQGIAQAQFCLGVMYYNGEGIAQSDDEAVKWFEKAAKQEDADAQCYLGYMYYGGFGVNQDFVEAKKWFEDSAEQGIPMAQYFIGDMYKDGYGVSQNYKEAVKWYKKSADLGYADAQYALGKMYYTGRGVTKNIVEATKWYERSAKQGNDDALFDLEFCWEELGLCRHCGGSFKGAFKKVCIKCGKPCGKPKDYKM